MKKTLLFLAAVCLFSSAVIGQVSVAITNAALIERKSETVSLDWQEVAKLNSRFNGGTISIRENDNFLAYQLIDANGDGVAEKLIFQVDFAAGEKSKTVFIEAATTKPTFSVKTFGRFVPERMDDFAWENDRVAFRTYGKTLEKELVSSGIDVWAKRVREPVIDKWYKGGDAFYHTDNGMGLDFYSVKKSRGCGGAGVWYKNKLYVSRNFSSYKVLANGPIRTVFELQYEPWDVGGVKVSENKRVTIDAGQNFYRVESFFDASDELRDIEVAVGIARHEADFKGESDEGKVWTSLWETNEKNGSLGCAVIAEPASFVSFGDHGPEFDFPMNLAIVSAKPDKVAKYYVGAGWSRSGDFPDKGAWVAAVDNYSARVASPLVATVTSSEELKKKRALPVSHRLTETAANRLWLDDGTPAGIPRKWTYEQGVILKGVEQLWYATGDPTYFDEIKRGMDYWIEADGSIKTYAGDEYNIDHVTPGKAAMLLYRVTGEEKYLKAVQLLRSQLKSHPRTNEGGFWHKKIYPYQMWLDGLYMAQPFYAEYSKVFNEDNWDDIANQFVWMEKHARDPRTGLLYHGWDESKQQRWANKDTGLSPHFWGRAMGWFAMALVDTLEHFPKDHPRRAELAAILNREAEAIAKVQDKDGLWWQVLDMPGRKKNYQESSAAAMFIYAIAKGIRTRDLPQKYLPVVRKGWAGVKQKFIGELPNGDIDWLGTVSVAGLGGNPYRDGSYDYYMSEKVVVNDPKGLGAAIKAAVEMEKLEKGYPGKAKNVVLDDYFNHEVKPDGTVWHYKWDELNHPGYYVWGKQFEAAGAQLGTLSQAPNARNLAGADVYIIVDPDTEKETAKPNFIAAQDINNISDWVKRGGTLVMLGNDFGNCEFENWNKLANAFGFEFNKDSKNRVQGEKFEQGLVTVGNNNPIFKKTRELHLKEVSTIKISGRAQTILSINNEPIAVAVRHGKGRVFAVGDPWLYNEYVDGRRLKGAFQNHQAAQELVSWLLGNTAKRRL